MIITEKTQYIDFIAIEDVMTDEAAAQLDEATAAKYGSYYDLSLRDFFAVMRKDFSCVGYDGGDDLDVLQGHWIHGFAAFVDKLTNIVKSYQLPQTAESMAAAAKCTKITFEESVLFLCREYFALHSFDAVYSLTISDYILAKKDTYNKVVFDREINKQITNKYKK